MGLVFTFFFFNDTATTEIYTLSLHDALPISASTRAAAGQHARADQSCRSWPPGGPACPGAPSPARPAHTCAGPRPSMPSSLSFGRERRGTVRTAVAFGQNASEIRALVSGRL